MLAIQSHWGLHQLPFTENAATAPFFPAESHEEALARLQYVVDHGRQASIIEGAPGSGKTFLTRFHIEISRERGLAGLWLNLRGATEADLAEQFAERLALSPEDPTSWSRIGQAFQEQTLIRGALVIACDDADHATPEALERLRNLTDHYGERVTIILTARTSSIGRLHSRFGGVSELRVTLEPWTIDDAEAYLVGSLESVGGDATMIETEAIARIHERAEGLPREMGRLARLSLLAGAGYQLNAIDAATVDSVADTL